MSTAAAATSIRHETVIDAPIERAFSFFTKDFGSFKPPEHNLLGVEIAETVFGHEWAAAYTTAASTAASATGHASSPTSRRTGS